MGFTKLAVATVLGTGMGAGSTLAAINPFTESFDVGPENWRDTTLQSDATWIASGGLDGSAYISGDVDVNTAAFGQVIALRGHELFDASNDAFVGNWRTDGVTEFSFDFRHDAPVPVNAAVRFASPFNFPAASAVDFIPVPPNTWTTITLAIDPFSPNFVSFENTDFNTVFTNIGNLQLGFSVPQALEGTGTVVNVDVDNVSIVPAPGIGLVGVSLMGLAARRRR